MRPILHVVGARPNFVKAGVDDPAILRQLLEVLFALPGTFALQVIFPVHPHTRARLNMLDIRWPPADQVQLIDPLGYLEFIALERRAALVITDSGGVQCLTVRESTERPVTVTLGTNTLVGRDRVSLYGCVEAILDGHATPGQIPPLWDGHSAGRIAESLVAH